MSVLKLSICQSIYLFVYYLLNNESIVYCLNIPMVEYQLLNIDSMFVKYSS